MPLWTGSFRMFGRRQSGEQWQFVKSGGKTYHWGLAWSGAGAGLGRTLIGCRPVRRWR